ncbi:DUF5615 family PIN-like protein [Streptosporangium sp. NPDC049304]|uniref:DUF5615 family PIN-like protein n=1 Tax=Streptosporangium sp. NPDC049304 TaxID=3154830 RepID=UPI003437CAE7
MRLLLDENVSRPLHQAINAFVLGHEIVHLLDLDRRSGTRDENLYPRAVAEGFHVILTNDAQQMQRPREVEAIAASGLHRIEAGGQGRGVACHGSYLGCSAARWRRPRVLAVAPTQAAASAIRKAASGP